MLRLPFVLLLLGVLSVTGPARCQTTPAQAPIVCEVKDNIEEPACQTKLKGMFTRNGDTLTINLDAGKTKKFVGNRAACDGESVNVDKCLIFRVARYYPQTQSYLIDRALYESGYFLFVSRRTGSEIAVSGEPVLSPNAKYLIATDQDDTGEREYDIAIWSMATDPPTQEFKYKAKQYENWEVTAWKDDTRIRMKAWINGKTSYDQEAELARKDNGWTLVLGKKTDRKN